MRKKSFSTCSSGASPTNHIDMMRYCGIDFEGWLKGFDSVECSVKESVDLLRHHPLMPKDVVIRGYIINTETGELIPQED